jgi:hypothetical protein
MSWNLKPALLGIAVIVLWIGIPAAAIRWLGSPANAGEFGDVFGSITALFTGLAFAGVVYAIILQQRELSLQREQLSLARTELTTIAMNQQESLASFGKQLAELQKGRSARAVIDILDYLNSSGASQARATVFTLPTGVTELEDSVRPEVESLLNRLNVTAYLIAMDLVHKRAAIEVLYITVIRMWYKLRRYIGEQRTSRGIYLYHLEWLVEESLQFWKSAHPDYQIQVFDPNSKRVETIDRAQITAELQRTGKARNYVIEHSVP